MNIKYLNISLLFLLLSQSFFAQVKVLDEFEDKSGWSFIQSDGVNLNITTEKGISGNAIRFDYDFTKGTGYGGIQKVFPIPLPENYEISFWVKATSPANNFEIKLLDVSGDNVWWKNNRNYTFPTEWKKIKIKKRHIEFAWGPTGGTPPSRFDRIEFTIASFVGGKGTLWIDDLKFETLPPESEHFPEPILTSTSNKKTIKYLYDNNLNTVWKSKNTKTQTLIFDFKQRREFGGLRINWLNNHQATDFEVLTSTDRNNWEKVFEVYNNLANQNFVRLPESDAKYLKINLLNSYNKQIFAIQDIELLTVKESETKNNFYKYVTKHAEKGHFPRYFSEQKTYWTICGVNNDTKEALLGEDGTVEVDKAAFSLEPLIKYNDLFYTWVDVQTTQSLNNNSDTNAFAFKPTVQWQLPDIQFKTELAAVGEANLSSELFIKYSFENQSNSDKNIIFYLLARPFQVNPYYQDLNLIGGVGKIDFIKRNSSNSLNVNDKTLTSSLPFSEFYAYPASQTDVIALLKNHKKSNIFTLDEPSGLASGVMEYQIAIPGNQTKTLYIKVPFHQNKSTFDTQNSENEFSKAVNFWQQKVNHIQFNLPKSADRIINTYKANLVYILINRDKAGIQPGSRSYERSWIRDGSLTSSALLKSGIVPEVKDYINWYADYLYENGKVPCVVDTRGPDPVPENDSHGQFIYAIREYFNFTKDSIFLRDKNEKVLKAVQYIENLMAQRSTDYYRTGNDSIRSLYGLVPESISHEGYSAKPMHSYWDNFFIIKGLKDAVEIQKIIGNKKDELRIAKLRDTFTENLYQSIALAMKNKNLNYIPGCAELGDFDATSTTVALSPCNEYNHLPKPELQNTFDKYYENFTKRKENNYDWVNYTPYENRVIGSFIMLNQPERAHELIDYFLHDQRPQGWYHWAEVVWRDARLPRYIGDMPHTWVGSDFLNAIRTMFVYENEWDSSLVLASALYQDWIDSPKGMSVEHLPTYYGEISYSIKKENEKYDFTIWGDVTLPENGIKIQNFNQSKMPLKVLVNGVESKTYTDKYIQINTVPCKIEIYY